MIVLCLCLVSSLTNGDKIMGRDLSVMTTMATIPHNEPWLAVIDTDRDHYNEAMQTLDHHQGNQTPRDDDIFQLKKMKIMNIGHCKSCVRSRNNHP